MKSILRNLLVAVLFVFPAAAIVVPAQPAAAAENTTCTMYPGNPSYDQFVLGVPITIAGTVTLTCDGGYNWATLQACLVFEGQGTAGCNINTTANSHGMSSTARAWCVTGSWHVRGLTQTGTAPWLYYDDGGATEIYCPINIKWEDPPKR